MAADSDGGHNGDRRRVLMICSAFPPTGGAGVQRSAKFAKYLPQFGWQPIVWSCGPLATLPRDESLVAELPDDLDHRTRSAWDTSHWPTRATELATAAVKLVGGSDAWVRGVHWRVDRMARGLVDGIVPDGQALWALGSVALLRRVVAREHIDVIYSTHSPPSNHLLAWRLKLATRKPWVSDYRDLWTQDCWYPFAKGPRWRVAADRYLERRFLQEANAVVSVSPSQTRILADRLPDGIDKFVTVTNGVDLDDFANVDRRTARVSCYGTTERGNRLVLAHVGRFTTERFKPPMLEGFARFVRWLGPGVGRLELRIVGWVAEELRRRMARAGVPVTTTGYLPHHRAIREMVAADVLLLQYPDETNADTAISGKLFEYFAARRPVLMIGPANSATRRLVVECEAGIGVDPDSESVYAALRMLWEQWSAGSLPGGCPPDRLTRYTRKHVTAELAAVLDTAHRRPR